MPDTLPLSQFLSELETYLEAAVTRYYDGTARFETEPRSALANVIQGLSRKVLLAHARDMLRQELRHVLTVAYQVAGNLGNDLGVTSTAQHRQVLANLAEALGYVDKFVRDTSSMTREQALARIRKYIPPVLQTFSQIATSEMPELPIYPGDPRLDCCKNGYPACKCHLEVVRRGPRWWEVRWVVDLEAEHCNSCKELGRTWQPLTVKDGRIYVGRRAA